ncbi:protease modulator HflC [Derxia lacustris]|uniref:protease modulator HflC n=1 Tax=Derxia lacustris TaxID=764842 RepID=UPI000A176FAB|nr:protease modulator HflC [Derxia lacustris]
MNKRFLSIAVLIAGLLLFGSSVFVVDQRQYAIVFTLGEFKRDIREPGLYFKLPPPFQNVAYFDRRILTIDTPDADRVQTSEKKNLLVDTYVKWRIADPRLFFVSFQGSERGAQDRMSIIVREALQNAVTRRTVNDVSSSQRDAIMAEVTQAVAERVRGLGVEIIDVRLKRVDFVPEISESVFRRMEAERKRVANEQRSIGSAEGEKIRADADRQREIILAQAYSEAQTVKGEGDAKAGAIYAEAFGQNPEFAAFYRSLEAYKSSFGKGGNVMVVDPSSDFFRYFRQSGSSSAPRR